MTAKDYAAVAGVALIAVGLWLTSPSAAIVTVGVLLLAAAVYGHLRAPKPPENEQ